MVEPCKILIFSIHNSQAVATLGIPMLDNAVNALIMAHVVDGGKLALIII